MDISCKLKPTTSRTNETGFTLVELMIGLFISGLVMAAVTTLYITQSKSFTKQDDIAGIQQNLRGVLAVLPMEIRLAGCDPTESKVPGILVATRTQFQFTRDISGNAVNANSADGDVNDTDENIAYALTARNNITNLVVATADSNDDGIIDTGGANWGWGTNTPSLGRQTGGGGGFQPFGDNIEALEFNYILDDGTTTATPATLNKIRSVQVSLLARAANQSEDFLHTDTYTTASGAVWTPPQDRYRRRLVITTIRCRNMR